MKAIRIRSQHLGRALALCSFSVASAAAQSADISIHGWTASAGHGVGEADGWSSDTAFSVPAGNAIDLHIEPGDENAAFTSLVGIAKAGKYRFACEVEGGHTFLYLQGTGVPESTMVQSSPGATRFTSWL